MAEELFYKVVNNEIEINQFICWLANKDQNKLENCSKIEFITYFLNFLHEEVTGGNNNNEAATQASSTPKKIDYPYKITPNLNKSMPSQVDTYLTPKIEKLSSPYLHPKTPASPLCLSDFITDKKPSTRKKKSNEKRRIKPTSFGARSLNLENSFNFKDTCEEMPLERKSLLQERSKINTINFPSGTKLKIPGNNFTTTADPKAVSNKQQLDTIINIYNLILDNNFVLNLFSEITFLINLLVTSKINSKNHNSIEGVEFLDNDIKIDKFNSRIVEYFSTTHNIVYFSAKILEKQLKILEIFDKSTINLLIDNKNLQNFTPKLGDKLRAILSGKGDRLLEINLINPQVCFISDTDNRQNFPSEQSFHAFRKQRDLFYDILKQWEQQHLQPNWDFEHLRGKIRTLFLLSSEPANFMHFTRLFKAQLLSNCGYKADENDTIASIFEIDQERLNRLKRRLVSKDNRGNSSPQFNEHQEFFKNFILTADCYNFNEHLKDCFINEIYSLNNFNLHNLELEDKGTIIVDANTQKSYYNNVKSLRILAKFLGFIESLPYITLLNYAGNIRTNCIKIRENIQPNFDIKKILDLSLEKNNLILCIPWLVKYLSMLDTLTLNLFYYRQVLNILFTIYRNFKSERILNELLVKFCLGWLFELPHFPETDFYNNNNNIVINKETDKLGLDLLNIVDQNILYLCCPYLDEIKKLLLENTALNRMKIKHITPVTAIQSPSEVLTKTQQDLEDTFFNGQPSSVKKSVEFISERIASMCIQFICNRIVPNYKKQCLVEFKTNFNRKKIDFFYKNLEELLMNETKKIIDEKVGKSIDGLMACDMSEKTKEILVQLTKKYCLNRVKIWITTNVTHKIFSKDFNEEYDKYAKGICYPNQTKTEKFKAQFTLPPGGVKRIQCSVSLSGADLIEKMQIFSISIMGCKNVDEGEFTKLLDEIYATLDKRIDINDVICLNVCQLLLEITLLTVAHNSCITENNETLKKLVNIWKLYGNSNDLFKTIICPRNVMLFAQSKNVEKTWEIFAKFCIFLYKEELLNGESLESQITGLFKQNWDEVSLKYITTFLKQLASFYKLQINDDKMLFLISFLSDYCEDL